MKRTHEREADERGDGALAHELRPERRADGALLGDGDRRRERAGLEDERDLVRLLELSPAGSGPSRA